MERSTIHLLHKRGKSQREIARELGRSQSTVARALSEPVDRQPSVAAAEVERRSVPRADRGVAEAGAERRADARVGARRSRAAVRRRQFGVAGGGAPRAAGGLHEQAVADVPIRFEGLPGEYLQVDWGEIRHFPFTQQPPATRYFLACRLKYSRWTWVRFTDDMRQETLFRGLVDCFLALGCVPWVLVFDNMKTVTIGRDDQAAADLAPALLQLAAEFGFHPEACWPASGNQKGSVESLVKWVKSNFLAGRTFADDADLQAQCVEWQEHANTRGRRRRPT